MPFSEAAMAAGVQPIIGALLAVARPGTPEGKAPVIDWLSLYAQDEQGYDNLCALVSASHLDRPIHEPAHVTMDALASRTNGMIELRSEEYTPELKSTMRITDAAVCLKNKN